MSDGGRPTRFWLGMLQMFGAVTGLILLVTTGVSIATLAIAGATTALTWSRRRLNRAHHD